MWNLDSNKYTEVLKNKVILVKYDILLMRYKYNFKK